MLSLLATSVRIESILLVIIHKILKIVDNIHEWAREILP